MAFAGSLGGFCTGYNTGVVAGATLYLQRDMKDITSKNIEVKFTHKMRLILEFCKFGPSGCRSGITYRRNNC